MQQRESGKRVSLSTMFQAVLIDFFSIIQHCEDGIKCAGFDVTI